MSRLTWRGNHPAFRLALVGILIAFAWELLQMPFYRTEGLALFQRVLRCGIASLGDGGIMVFAYLVASYGNKGQAWLIKLSRARFAAYLSIGIATTLAVEYVATGSSWGWSYNSAMPILPGTKIGAVPVLMWLVVPTSALLLTRRLGTEVL